MLGIDELNEVLEKIREVVTIANRNGTLNELLDKLGIENESPVKFEYETYKSGKIVVIGNNEIGDNKLKGVAKELGIEAGRFEFVSFNESVKYDYKKLQYAPKYRVIMFGAVPHSTSGKGDNSSVIANLEKEEGYPRVIRLTSNNSIKITKSNFREALEMLLDEGYI